jgi:hypothetical protein
LDTYRDQYVVQCDCGQTYKVRRELMFVTRKVTAEGEQVTPRRSLSELPAIDLRGVFDMITVLQFYAAPESYHAVAFDADAPAGGFASDFSKDHGDEFYNREMPGQAARSILRRYGIEY